MKVCFVSHSSQMGGAETAMLETIEALKAAGALDAELEVQ